MKRTFLLVGMLGILSAMLACAGLGNAAAPGAASGSSGYNTKFPLPSSVSNFTTTGDNAINFQTKVGLKDSIEFYRTEFTKLGLTERSINTSITDTTFSLVFDGDSSGKAIVVQGVDLGNGSTNVNIRYEDV